MPLIEIPITNPKGPAAIQVANLTWILFGIAAVARIAVTVLLLIAVFRRRQGELKTDQPLPGDRRALRWVIIAGAVAPAVILIASMALSIPIENVFASNGNSATGGLTIEVIAHQWWWEVLYPADGFSTANEIHIPVGKPVTFKLTSADVLHSFSVPQLHPQLIMIPGQTNTLILQANQPGTYQGECTEYCGIQHAHMDFVIIAQSQADYEAWVSQQKQPAPDPPVGSMEKFGQQAFLGSACVYCHTIQGTNASGKLGPDLTHLANRTTIGAGIRPMTPANLAGWIINAQDIKPGNKMPPINLDPDQIQAILAYLESLK